MAALHGRGTRSSTPNSVSAVQTVTHSRPETPRIFIPDGPLRLRGASADDRRVMWAEDVVDNEGMGKKKSKVCCIYHKPRAVGESSEEDSSSSDSSSDSDEDNSTARMAGGKRQHGHHDHGHGDDGCEHNSGLKDSKGKGRARSRKRSPNAYEKMPKHASSKKTNP